MHFVEIVLKSGKLLNGIILNHDSSSMIKFLSFQNETLTPFYISKSAVKEKKNLRPLSDRELRLVEEYIRFSKEASQLEYFIRKAQAQLDITRLKCDEKLEELTKEVKSNQRNDLDILTFHDIESLLTHIGYKNLFWLHRHGILSLGENEEIIFRHPYKPEQANSFVLKQKEDLSNILNQPFPDKIGISNALFRIAKESPYLDFRENTAFHLKQKANSNDSSKEINHSTAPSKNKEEKKSESLNFYDIKGQLNESGFQALKELQDAQLLTIKEDGTMEFGEELSRLPFVGEIFKNKQLLVEFLNGFHHANYSFPIFLSLTAPIFKELKNLLET
jgi:uncharacterized protein YaaR (DUF327 family)